MRDFTVPCEGKRQVVDLTDPYQALPNTTKTAAGTVVGFKCKTDNYVISGNYNYITCKPNGEWDNPDPICTEPTMSSTTIILVMVCSILGALLLLAVATLASWYFCFRPDDRKRGWRCGRLTRIITDFYHGGENKGSYRRGKDPRQSLSPRGLHHSNDDYRDEEFRHHGTFPTKWKISKSFLQPPGPLPRYASSDDGESLPSEIASDPVIQNDEYDIRVKIPRSTTTSSKPVLEPWTVERDFYHVEHNPIYG